MKNAFLYGLLVAVLLGVGFPATGVAQAQSVGFGILGDSMSDEYRADDNRGGAYASTTLNWMEQLVRFKGFDFGPWATRSDVRRTGYEYNWSRSGATSGSLISQGQHTGLASQVAQGKIQYAVLMIGANDYAPWNGNYSAIYNGTVSGQALTNKINGIISNIRLASDTVLAAGPVKLVIATVGDIGQSAYYSTQFPDPVKRQRVTDAIIQTNAGIQSYAQSKGLNVVDIYNLGMGLLSQLDPYGNLIVGNELISVVQNGDEPHHFILGDNRHSGTVGSAVMTNMILDQWNAYGLGAAIFTDGEMLAHAGIAVVDTTTPSVTLTSPAEGSTLSESVTVSASATDNVGVAGVQFKLDGNNFGLEDTSAPYSINLNTTLISNGSHTVSATTHDASGNVATSETVNITVANTLLDITAPTVSVTFPTSGSTVSGVVSATATAADNVEVVGLQFQINGINLGTEDTQAPYSAIMDTTQAPNGSYSMTTIARDAAGNTATSAPVSFTINNGLVDITAPSVTVTSPANGATISGTVTVGATATDNTAIADVQFFINGVEIQAEDTTAPYEAILDTEAYADGQYTITAIARDTAGNTATSQPINVTVNNFDTTAPQVTITNPTNGTTVGGTITVSATASDNTGVVGVQFALNGINFGSEVTTAPYTQMLNTSLTSNGSHTLTARARDLAGNSTTATSTFNISNVASQTLLPLSYTVVKGVYNSGSLESLTADDNSYLIGRSTLTAGLYWNSFDFTFKTTVTNPARLDFNTIVKSSASTVPYKVYVFNYATNSWVQFLSTTLNTRELVANTSITTNAADYIGPDGTIKYRTEDNKNASHWLYHEVVNLTVN